MQYVGQCESSTALHQKRKPILRLAPQTDARLREEKHCHDIYITSETYTSPKDPHAAINPENRSRLRVSFRSEMAARNSPSAS